MNLENLGVQEMNTTEMKNVDGGFVCLGFCIVGAVALGGLIGVGVGYGIAAAADYFTP